VFIESNMVQGPRTQAVLRALRAPDGDRARDDLLFFEAWERDPPRDLATMLRAGQIRRANPGLAAAIQAELKAG